MKTRRFRKKNTRRTRKKYCPYSATLPSVTVYGHNKGYMFEDIKIHRKRKTFPKTGHKGRKAFNIISKYLYGDKMPDRNFITFVNTTADPYQNKIHSDTKKINFIDTQPYYRVKEMEQQMVKMMANLFKDNNYAKANGASTIGSSEAIYVSVILHRFAWEERHKKPAINKCNMIWSENTHINWDKSARYNDVTAQKIPLKHLDYTFGADEVKKRINKRTIAVVCTLCATRSAQNDKIEEINTFLKQYHKETGIFVPIHIDAAIGGFLTPFIKPKLKWSFDLEHVKSINVSFHKYGGTYAGMGMIVVQSDYKLPKKMRFFFDAEHMNLPDTKTRKQRLELPGDPHNPQGDTPYLDPITQTGGERGPMGQLDPEGALDLQINFTKSSSQVVEAFYIFMKLGMEGYKKRIAYCMKMSKILSNYINSIKSKSGKKVFIQVNEPYYPVIAFCLDDTTFPLKEVLQHLAEENGYSVAAYKMGNTDDIVFRLVFKHNVSKSEAIRLRDAWKATVKDIYYSNDKY